MTFRLRDASDESTERLLQRINDTAPPKRRAREEQLARTSDETVDQAIATMSDSLVAL